MIRYALIVIGSFWTLSAAAAEIQLKGDFTQGGLVIGRIEPGSTVQQDGAPVTVSPNGQFLLGFGRESSPSVRLTFQPPGGKQEERQLQIKPRRYNIQRIDGLPRRQVTPSPADLKRIKAESKRMAVARKTTDQIFRLSDGLVWPARGRISGVYGSQRILNGEPRRPHFGVDVAAPIGTEIVAPAGGIVRLAHGGMFFNGKTVVLDHGLGLHSVFLHLNAIEVAEGAVVKKGQRIGRIGRSTMRPSASPRPRGVNSHQNQMLPSRKAAAAAAPAR